MVVNESKSGWVDFEDTQRPFDDIPILSKKHYGESVRFKGSVVTTTTRSQSSRDFSSRNQRSLSSPRSVKSQQSRQPIVEMRRESRDDEMQKEKRMAAAQKLKQDEETRKEQLVMETNKHKLARETRAEKRDDIARKEKQKVEIRETLGHVERRASWKASELTQSSHTHSTTSLESRAGNTRDEKPAQSQIFGQSSVSSSNSSRGKAESTSREANRSRPRSSSQQRAASRGRARSRPPLTRENTGQRPRSRSTSLTRVTSPTTSRVTSPTTSRASVRRPPPSTYRTQLEMRGGRSIAASDFGAQSLSARSDDGLSTKSANDVKIGRNISFGKQEPIVSEKTDKGKNGGLMEKLFGDKVNDSARAAVRRGLRYDIHPRILLAATVYHNTATNLWITTVNTNQRGVAKNPKTANRYLKAFSFASEIEARESAIANAPPKMLSFSDSPTCFICKGKFAVFRRACHCRNCGVCVCSGCTTSWAAKMLPSTYNLKNEAQLNVCLACDGLSAAFKTALLAGDYEEAVALYGTGNVNLRTPFPVSNKKDEIMYPVHCAVEGGNLNVLRWLVDDHFCPIKIVKSTSSKSKQRGGTDVPLLTSRNRTVLGIAVERVKVDIIRYLVVDCGISIYEATDLNSSLRALEAALLAMPRPPDRRTRKSGSTMNARWDKASFDDMSEPSSLGQDDHLLDEIGTLGGRSHRTRGSKGGDPAQCIICCDRKIDCVATPCGHQICCIECSKNLSSCPVCNNRGDFIKVFRP